MSSKYATAYCIAFKAATVVLTFVTTYSSTLYKGKVDQICPGRISTVLTLSPARLSCLMVTTLFRRPCRKDTSFMWLIRIKCTRYLCLCRQPCEKHNTILSEAPHCPETPSSQDVAQLNQAIPSVDPCSSQKPPFGSDLNVPGEREQTNGRTSPLRPERGVPLRIRRL
jgi:hypothetical protein